MLIISDVTVYLVLSGCMLYVIDMASMIIMVNEIKMLFYNINFVLFIIKPWPDKKSQVWKSLFSGRIINIYTNI